MLKSTYLLHGILFFSILLSSCQKDETVAAWVEGAPITTSEMNYWMLLNKAEVSSFFYLNYGVNDNGDFWSSTYEGESPLEMLKTLSLDDARRCKVQQLLAYEKGLVTDINFDVLVSNIPSVNQERADKVKRGEVIYGPKKYTIRTYFSYQHDKMVYDLKEKLMEHELKPTREDLEALKPNAETSVDDYTGFLSMQFVDENYDAFIDEKVTTSEVKLHTKVWNSITL